MGHGIPADAGAGLTLSFLRALNFFRHSTVSCLCIMEATVERCCGERDCHTLPGVARRSFVPKGGWRAQGQAQGNRDR